MNDSDQYKALIQFMSSFKGEKDGKYSKKNYCTACYVKLSGPDYLYCQAGISHHKLYAKFEFNPTKLSTISWETLACHFQNFFDDGLLGFFQVARIYGLEIAVDVPFINFNELHLIDLRLKYVDDYYLEKGGLYLGAKASPIHWCIYNKKLQLDQVYKQVLQNQLIRIEARLMPKQLELVNFQKHKNPFLSLRVLSKGSIDSPTGNSVWKKFRQNILDYGKPAQTAFLELTPIERKAIEIPLHQASLPWWNPTKFWDEALVSYGKMMKQALNQECN